jgi:hypothetical protein
MVCNDSELSQIVPKKFVCEKCNYSCSSKKDYTKHLTTRKHHFGVKMIVNDSDLSPNHSSQSVSKIYTCECGKTYKWDSGYYRHKKTCSIVQGTYDSTNTNKFQLDKELLIKMLLKNQEVMEKMVEMMPQMGNNSHNINNSHTTNNNQCNIQMFLNEHCKNAMNLTDFIESLPITAATYDSTIENGLTKTITNMITNGLSKLDILERPIHCTDATRKTLYVKEENVWEKDTELLNVVAGITNLIRKKRTLICRWKEANRGWDTIERKQIKFTELVCNIMTDIEYDEKETGKIVRSISKTVYLDNEAKKKYIC